MTDTPTTAQIVEAVAAAKAAMDANERVEVWERPSPHSLPAVERVAELVSLRLAALMGWEQPLSGANGAVLTRDLATVDTEGMDHAILCAAGLDPAYTHIRPLAL